VAAPSEPTSATEAACVKVLAQLPVQLTGDLPPRRLVTDSALVRAWGDPAVILRCGVARPAGLQPAATADLIAINGVNWLAEQNPDATVFTSVDRSVYIEVTVPKRITAQPMSLIATAAAVLSAVCTTIDAAGNSTPGLPFCGSRP
jgi:hypothetical protein